MRQEIINKLNPVIPSAITFEKIHPLSLYFLNTFDTIGKKDIPNTRKHIHTRKK